MTKEIIGFINRNNDIFNIKEDESTSKYCCKAGQGHEDKIATFTEDGDVKDSNKTIDDFVTKIQPSADGNLASLDENGNLQDSGKNVNDFAPGDHTHTYINNTSENVYAEVITESANNDPHVDINLDNGDGEFARATIDLNNINNLGRALTNPNAPISGGDSLITNGQVFTALQTHTHNKVENIVENAQSAKLYADNQNQGEPAIIIELSDNNTPEGSVTKSANINIESIDNLNRALDKPDTAPDSGSDNLVTSGGVYTALLSKANSSHTHTVNNVNNLLSTIISLTERIRALEVPVSKTITLHGDYHGYNTLLNSSNEDIMTVLGTTNRARLVNLENLIELAQIGSKVTLYYDYDTQSHNFTTVVVDKGTTYGKNYILLNDEIPDLPFHQPDYSNIILAITK